MAIGRMYCARRIKQTDTNNFSLSNVYDNTHSRFQKEMLRNLLTQNPDIVCVCAVLFRTFIYISSNRPILLFYQYFLNNKNRTPNDHFSKWWYYFVSFHREVHTYNVRAQMIFCSSTLSLSLALLISFCPFAPFS